MKYIEDDKAEKPGKPKVYEITIRTLDKLKKGWKVNYEHTIKKEG